MLELLLSPASLHSETKIFLGTVSGNDFITAEALTTEIELSAGTSLETIGDWLHYATETKEFLVAKKPFRYNMTYSELATANAIDGSRLVNINGKQYKLRLLTGGTPVPASSDGGEWNEFIYPICAVRPAGSPVWADYTTADIGLNVTIGGRSLMSDSVTTGEEYTLVRGSGSTGTGQTSHLTYYFASYPKTFRADRIGWRPVLELVQE